MTRVHQFDLKQMKQHDHTLDCKYVRHMCFPCKARDEDLHGERSPQHPHTEDSPRLVLKINSNIRVRTHCISRRILHCAFFNTK